MHGRAYPIGEHEQTSAHKTARELENQPALERDVAAVLHRHGVDDALNTPDYILAAYVNNALTAYAQAKSDAERHSRS